MIVKCCNCGCELINIRGEKVNGGPYDDPNLPSHPAVIILSGKPEDRWTWSRCFGCKRAANSLKFKG